MSSTNLPSIARGFDSTSKLEQKKKHLKFKDKPKMAELVEDNSEANTLARITHQSNNTHNP